VKPSATSALSAVLAIATALIVTTVRTAEAQQPPRTPSPWKQPMTPWGEPDPRGIWPLDHLISTPFQRPEKFGDRRFQYAVFNACQMPFKSG
jgi:hypothetical protein